MDPLFVSASIAGLMTAAQQVSSLIGLILRCKSARGKDIRDIKKTVDSLSCVLRQLQLLLSRRIIVNPERASLILVDQVVLKLTACVMTFSDLSGCVQRLSDDKSLGVLDAIRWASKETELLKYLRNLEAHKSSLTLMISILTW